MKTLIQSLVVAVPVALLVACGNPIDEFVGLYDETGTYTVTLNTPNGPATETQQGTSSVTVMEGARSDLIIRTGECSIPFDVDDFESASVVVGSTCTQTSSNGAVTTFTFNSGAIQRGTKFSNVTLNAGMSMVLNGATYSGTYSMNATWIKASK